MSPYDQGGSVSLPIGRRPALYSSTSASRPFQIHALPEAAAAGPALASDESRRSPRHGRFIAPGSSDATGSTLNGSGSHSNLDLFDRFSRRQFVDGRHGQNRFALIERLVGQRLLALWVGSNDLARVVDLILGTRHFVGRQDRFHAGHGERRARVDAPDARVRERAEEEPREQHPLARGNLRRTVARPVTLARRSGVE